MFLYLLILKPFICSDSCKVSLQGFCFFDLYFYTLKSQLRYPSFIPFSDLTLSSQSDPQSLRTGLHSKPGYGRTRAENQSHTSPQPQGDTSCKAEWRPANPQTSLICPRENSPLSTLWTFDIIFECVWVLFIPNTKPDRCLVWHGNWLHGNKCSFFSYFFFFWWGCTLLTGIVVADILVNIPCICFWLLFSWWHTCHCAYAVRRFT